MHTHPSIPAATETYEFPATYDARLTKTASWARQLALVNFIAAGLALYSHNFFGVALQVAVGLLLWLSARSLRAVVTTAGHDVEHLIVAARRLASLLRARLILAIVGFGALGFGLVAIWIRAR